jgi:hypothetical protein
MDSLQPIDDPNQAVVGAGRPPVIAPGHTFGTVTDKISSIVLTRKTPLGWYLGFGASFMLTIWLMVSLTYLVLKGVGIWGVNIPVGWGFAIVNFVWWIGIGHAGTLISAILLLLKQTWRTSINRFAEAMTLFAVRRHLSGRAHRPPVARLLALPVSELDGCVAAVPESADLGRVCGLDLRDRVAAVLVRRPDSGPRDAA